MTVTVSGTTETLTVVDHQGPQVCVTTPPATVTLDTVQRNVTVAVQGLQGPPGTGLNHESLTLEWTGDMLTVVTGETFTKTLVYGTGGRLETVTTDTGVTKTISYDSGGRVTDVVVT